MAIILDANSFFSDTYQGYLETRLFSAIAKALPQQQFLTPLRPLTLTQTEENIQALSFPAAKGLFWRGRQNKWLKEQRATAFISFNRTLKTKLPIQQILIISDEMAINNREAILTANAIGIVSIGLKQLFSKKYLNMADKFFLVESVIDKENHLLHDYDVKAELTEHKEYFITTDFRLNKESLVCLLKGFSAFKKRQQSNWKLMIVIRSEEAIAPLEAAALLSNYKFREDVVLTNAAHLNNKINAAYAAVSLCNNELFPIPIIEAAKQGTPVISVKTNTVEQMFGDAVLYPVNNESEAIGDMLMTMYKGETFRKNLIKKISSINLDYDLNHAASELVRVLYTNKN